MCLIVDANLASAVFASPPGDDFSPILDWLDRGDGCLVFGGRLATEMSRLHKPHRYLLALWRAGRARRLPDEQVEQEESVVADTGLCRSNDSHVLALARVSGARVLCTDDKKLQRDFKNPQLVARPRGSVYQRREHTKLLRHTTSCGRLEARRKKRK